MTDTTPQPANYIDQIATDIYREMREEGEPPQPDAADMPLYRIYAVLALTTGTATTGAQVHDAWSAWQSGIMPEHRSIVEYDLLTPQVQALDEPYALAIRKVAGRRSGMRTLDDGTKLYV